MKTRNILWFPAILAVLLASCGKDFLDKRPDKALLVPATLEDMQALLDNVSIMNYAPALNTLADGDYYTTDNGLKLYNTAAERNTYLWLREVYEGQSVFDWNVPYQQIFYANVVLDGLKKLDPDEYNPDTRNEVRGSALFFRALALYHLTQSFTVPYSQAVAGTAPGIPVPLTADVNQHPGRGTLQQTYDRLTGDMLEADSLLPLKGKNLIRPGKWAAKAMLARIYLSMQRYDQALKYASDCLLISDQLIDYNTLNAAGVRPVPANNEEIIFYEFLTSLSFIAGKAVLTQVDSNLYHSYGENDLRKTVFMRDRGNGVINFKGNYTGTSTVFSGPATDEMYLIRAECYARDDQPEKAMADLNALLQTRWKTGTFVPLEAAGADEALKLVLNERRKELISRGTRWTDLRRLNQDPEFAVTLKRVIEEKEYTLPPGDDRYVFPIPDEEIAGSGIAQNPR